MSLQDKLVSTRTRPAEIMGEAVLVKVYSAKEWAKIGKDIAKYTDKKMAEFVAGQFLNEDGSPALTADFLQSDDCPACVTVELMKTFTEVNSGQYAKK